MPLNIKHLDYIRGLKSPEFPDLGSKLVEALTGIQNGVNNIEQQGNFNAAGEPAPPPNVSGVTVAAQNGHFNVAIHDNNPLYRGVKYFVEHADNPHFQNSHTEDIGTSRNANFFLGNTDRYFRAFSGYSATRGSQPAYHGSQAAPIKVSGGGSVGPPAFAASQSSGTGTPGQGLSGQGIEPFRAVNGKPPQR